MKSKILFLIVLNFFIYCNCSICLAVTGELIIKNNSTETLKVNVYPIGTIFNNLKSYSLDSKLYQNPQRKIIGGLKEGISTNQLYTLDHDVATGIGADSIIGYGKYRVIFYTLSLGNYDSVDYCDVDYSDSE